MAYDRAKFDTNLISFWWVKIYRFPSFLTLFLGRCPIKTADHFFNLYLKNAVLAMQQVARWKFFLSVTVQNIFNIIASSENSAVMVEKQELWRIFDI